MICFSTHIRVCQIIAISRHKSKSVALHDVLWLHPSICFKNRVCVQMYWQTKRSTTNNYREQKRIYFVFQMKSQRQLGVSECWLKQNQNNTRAHALTLKLHRNNNHFPCESNKRPLMCSRAFNIICTYCPPALNWEGIRLKKEQIKYNNRTNRPTPNNDDQNANMRILQIYN